MKECAGMENLHEGIHIGNGGLCQKICDAPDVYHIRVPYPNITTDSTNSYAICDGGECLVVDTGAFSEEGLAVFLEALELIGANLESTSFFLTHLHKDHAGLVDRVVPPNRPLYAGKRDFELNEERAVPGFKNLILDRFVSEGIPEEEARVYAAYEDHEGKEHFEGKDLHLIEPGDELHVGAYTLQVVDTAGHTPGHLSLLEPKSGLFFGGDHILFVVSPVLELHPSASGIMDSYLRTLGTVASMDISLLCHSHGPLVPEWRDRTLHLIRHHEKRLAEVKGYVDGRPGITGEQIVKSIKFSVDTSNWMAIKPALRWCIVSESFVILDCLVERGDIVRRVDEQGLRRYTPNK